MDALRENCKIRNLQSTKWFLKKIIQVCSHMSSFKRRILDSQFLDSEHIILYFLLSLEKRGFHCRVTFTSVYKIEAMYGRSCVNV